MQSCDKNYNELINYFKSAIFDESKNIGHCILFWGGDIQTQYNLAIEIARLYNCSNKGEENCDCINCRWIKEKTHPAVKTFTRLDFKETSTEDEESTSGKKNISVAQAKSIIQELTVSSDYHRVYIFCDRDEEGNLLPLNSINFPEATSNALLKTLEEPPQNTTFFILTQDRNDIISTVVSRSQTFFVPSTIKEDQDFSVVENLFSNYLTLSKNDVLNFEKDLTDLCNEHTINKILTQIQNFMLNELKNKFNDKRIFYKVMHDLEQVEIAKRQNSIIPAMNSQTIIENLCFKLLL